MNPAILVVEDSAEARAVFQTALSASGARVVTAASAEEAQALIRKDEFDVVLCDLRMPGIGGRGLLQYVQRENVSTPVIVVTGYADWDSAEECMNLGAFDYLAKPVDRASLLASVRRALVKRGLSIDSGNARPAVKATPRFPHIVGNSDAMVEVFRWIGKVAECDTNVCIYGESGTGKELVARAIHYTGARKDRPLITLDCAAIPEGLMESEMFGHVRGAFTSAMADREGVFQLADKGTLFLDEVGELSLALMAKLLRVIQCREFRKVGGTKPIHVDIRIIVATNKDLKKMVDEGRFREDLYYRLDVIPISLPPLRNRREDIPLLVDFFVERFNKNGRKKIRGVSSRTMGLLLKYHWPGNVRELENCLERAGVLTDGDIIDVEDLSQILRSRTPDGDASGDWNFRRASLHQMEREFILKTLREVQGNKTRAAELLGISLRGLHYKLREFERERAVQGLGDGGGRPLSQVRT